MPDNVGYLIFRSGSVKRMRTRKNRETGQGRFPVRRERRTTDRALAPETAGFIEEVLCECT